MPDVTRWFRWLMVVLVLHMAEQLAFGIDELYELQAMVGAFQRGFANPDYATVVLVGAGTLLVQLIAFAGLSGGRWTLAIAGFFGVEGVGEVHHLVKTAVNGAYFPGAVTALVYVLVGARLALAVAWEWRAAGDRMPAQYGPAAL